ncbi:MAG: hypothetical protein JJ899_02465 [Alphaproteobacteria bacterium]|nr:hypothetical protein [Alphaproteobacteria bacterium]
MSESSPEMQSSNAVAAESSDAELEQFGRERASGDAPRERACMMCGTKFESEGWHNRLCGSCRKRSAPLG